MAISALTLDETLKEIPDDQLKALKGQILGRVIEPQDAAYEEARRIWNGMIDRRPALIIECTGTVDVIHAARFANKHRLLISVRGAGHNIAGRSLHDRMLLIDLSRMRQVSVDPEEKTATVSPGATLRDLDHETQAFGLAVPVGINSTTGVGGLTLGGGFGWLSRSLGMTVDNLISIEAVTVEGERLVADKINHPDLFWAISGGGGNFAIVTSFKFKLAPVSPEVMCGPVVFDFAQAKDVLKRYREICKKSPDEMTVWAVLRNCPPFPFVESSFHGMPALILVGIYNGTLDKGKEALSQLGKIGKPKGIGISPHRFTDFQQAFDPLLVPGARNYWKSHNLMEISDGLIDVLLDFGKRLPSPFTEIFIGQLGGATNRVDPQATAYPHRNIEFIMNVHTRWEDKSQDDSCVTWARNFYKAAEPFATGGVYVNFVSEGDESVEQAYAENGERLATIKSKYDPDNRLRSNLNVKPV